MDGHTNEQYAKLFNEQAHKLFNDTTISIISVHEAHQRGQEFCMPIGFDARDMVRYLDDNGDDDGVQRLRDLKKHLNKPQLGLCDYDGAFIVKWGKANEWLFQPHEDLDAKCLAYVVQDPLVYLNAKPMDEEEEMDEYIAKHYSGEVLEHAKRANEMYDEDIAWFWVGEW